MSVEDEQVSLAYEVNGILSQAESLDGAARELRAFSDDASLPPTTTDEYTVGGVRRGVETLLAHAESDEPSHTPGVESVLSGFPSLYGVRESAESLYYYHLSRMD